MNHRSDAVGLVLARPARMLGLEPFFMELIAGMEEVLAADGRSLLLHVVKDMDAEIAAYRRWAAGEMVDAVVIVNLTDDDARLAVVAELGLPAVVVGGPRSGFGFSNVWIDDAQAMRDAVGYLADHLGHRRLARVSGPAQFEHTRQRSTAFLEECARRGVEGTIVEGDYTDTSGERCTRALLGRGANPTAIVFDNDVMAVAAVGVGRGDGCRGPGPAVAARLGRLRTVQARQPDDLGDEPRRPGDGHAGGRLPAQQARGRPGDRVHGPAPPSPGASLDVPSPRLRLGARRRGPSLRAVSSTTITWILRRFCARVSSSTGSPS